MEDHKRCQHFVNGSWIDPEEGGRFEVLDPATEEVLTQVAAGTAADVRKAVAAANDAQQTWGKTSGTERAAYLRAIAQAVKDSASELAHLEVQDNGKPLPEADWDIEDAAGCFEFYADLAEELEQRQGRELSLPDNRFSSRVYLEPVGAAGLIVPWNYPLLMAAWKVAPALAAGCATILKPSELTPLTALELAGITARVGLPAGVFNVVTGFGPQAGAPLVEHPDLRKLAFTGSVPIGRGVMAAGARQIKNVSLELGGKSPFLVFDDVDIEAAVEWIMFGIFWNQGQVCSATSRLLVQEGVADKLLARLAEEADHIPIGNGLTEGVKLGPLVSAGQLSKVESAVKQSVADGAGLLVGGERPEEFERGFFYKPTVLTNVPLDSKAWTEEIFGPVLAVRTFRHETDAVKWANDSPYGLAAAIMTRDKEKSRRLARELEAGIVWVNCSQPTFTQAPWGGVKESGIGRELGQWGLDNYLEVKQVTTYESQEAWGWYLQRVSSDL
jgi:betaine-aldehyde dehydrogenase